MKEDLKYKRCKVISKSGYWFDVLFGGLSTFIILFLVGNLYLEKSDLAYLNVPYFLCCIFIIAYFQWKDDNFEVIETALSIKQNFEITEKALEKLNWKYSKNSTEIKLSYDNKLLLKFLEVTLIPGSKIIYFNFKYYPTSRAGRYPFFFGISWLMKRKFKKQLQQELKR